VAVGEAPSLAFFLIHSLCCTSLSSGLAYELCLGLYHAGCLSLSMVADLLEKVVWVRGCHRWVAFSSEFVYL
jgi:hypothetical protein